MYDRNWETTQIVSSLSRMFSFKIIIENELSSLLNGVYVYSCLAKKKRKKKKKQQKTTLVNVDLTHYTYVKRMQMDSV